MSTEAKPHAGRPHTKERLVNFKFTAKIIAFLGSLPRGKRTEFIEELIKASAQYQRWQTK